MPTSDTRLYAAAIAVASGLYSVASSTGDQMGAMPMSDSVMLLVGIAVILHGLALLTPMAERIAAVSGPLMIVWAGIMLANQLLAATSGSMMGAGWDGGMVALAALMLVSGALMTRRRDSM
jgi:uncharacterized membrane protein